VVERRRDAADISRRDGGGPLRVHAIDSVAFVSLFWKMP
jgi:hypothetical protein